MVWCGVGATHVAIWRDSHAICPRRRYKRNPPYASLASPLPFSWREKETIFSGVHICLGYKDRSRKTQDFSKNNKGGQSGRPTKAKRDVKPFFGELGRKKERKKSGKMNEERKIYAALRRMGNEVLQNTAGWRRRKA